VTSPPAAHRRNISSIGTEPNQNWVYGLLDRQPVRAGITGCNEKRSKDAQESSYLVTFVSAEARVERGSRISRLSLCLLQGLHEFPTLWRRRSRSPFAPPIRNAVSAAEGRSNATKGMNV
jgi:hypothetical protein